MKPTRRGVAVAAVACAAALMASVYGPRSLNAIILPAVVALAAGVVQVFRVPAVSVRRRPPPDGFPGETGGVVLRFDAGRPFPATVTDDHSAGLDGGPSVETVVGEEPVEYTLTYRERGEQTLGPVELAVEDVLGLFRRSVRFSEHDTVLVYPRLSRLPAGALGDLRSRQTDTDRPERGEFDTLREYVRGDTPRDIHWKSSAKRDDLVVKEFAASERAEAVTVAAGAADGHADAMAEAAASLGVALLDAEVPVSVATPDGEVEAEPGERRRLLGHLARSGAGAVPAADADVVVEATADGTTVRMGERELAFDRLEAGSPEVPA